MPVPKSTKSKKNNKSLHYNNAKTMKIIETTTKYPTSIEASVMNRFHPAIWNLSMDLVQPANANATITARTND